MRLTDGCCLEWSVGAMNVVERTAFYSPFWLCYDARDRPSPLEDVQHCLQSPSQRRLLPVSDITNRSARAGVKQLSAQAGARVWRLRRRRAKAVVTSGIAGIATQPPEQMRDTQRRDGATRRRGSEYSAAHTCARSRRIGVSAQPRTGAKKWRGSAVFAKKS